MKTATSRHIFMHIHIYTCIYSERGLGKYISEVKLGDKSEVKCGYTVGIAHPV
jgi:hypothetical protein